MDIKELNIPNVCFSLDDGSFENSKEYKKQRETRGFDETECWNLDTTIAKFILPRLKCLKEIKHGYPYDLSEEQWDEILDKMILAFDLQLKEGSTMKLEEMEANTKIQDEGLELFAKYYHDLWD